MTAISFFYKSDNDLNAHLGNKHSKERDGWTNHNKRAYIMNKPDDMLDNRTGLRIPRFKPLLIN